MVWQTANYGDKRIRYQVCYIPIKRNRVAIHVHPDGSVQVDAPENADMVRVKQAVLKRARWILKHVDEAERRKEHVLPREYVSGESHFYLGRRYMLKVVFDLGAAEDVKLVGGKFLVWTHERSADRVRRLLNHWYRNHAREYFARRLDAVVDRIKWLKEPPGWRLLAMKKQWGSCSPKGVLSLNPYLVKAPMECVDYVLIHELCHLREHNHSKEYYSLLEEIIPEWKPVKAKLDGMAELLLNE